MAEAVRAINNVATPKIKKDTPSLIDVNGLGRPKEFTGKDHDFQQWSKKTEAFFSSNVTGKGTLLESSGEERC